MPRELGLDVKSASDQGGRGGQIYRTHQGEISRAGVKSGVNGTPSFFINGVLDMMSGRGFEALLSALQ